MGFYIRKNTDAGAAAASGATKTAFISIPSLRGALRPKRNLIFFYFVEKPSHVVQMTQTEEGTYRVTKRVHG